MRSLFAVSLTLLSSVVPVAQLSVAERFGLVAYAQSEQAINRVVNAADVTGDWALVEKMWRQRLIAAPEDSEAWIGLGYALKAQGEESAAIEAFRAALEIVQDSAAAQIGLGLVLQAQGKFDAAQAAYESAIASDPSAPYGYLHLGRLMQDRRSLDEAAKTFQKMVAIAPIGHSGAIAYWELGNIYAAQGKLAEAETAYWRAIGLDIHRVESWQSLLGVVQSQGRTDALASIAREIRFLKEQNAEDLAERTAILQQDFDTVRQSAQVETARSRLQQYPDNVTFLQDLGVAQRKLGEFEAAESAFRRAVALSPNNIRAHYNLSEVLRDLDRTAEADTVYQQAKTLYPSLIEPGKTLSAAEIDYTTPALRLANLSELRSPVPVPFPDALRPLPHSLRVSSLPFVLPRLSPRFAIDIEQQLALDPDNAVLHGLLGDQLYADGDIEGAAAAFERMAVLDPRLADIAFNNVGVLRAELEQFDLAEVALDRATLFAMRKSVEQNSQAQNLQQNVSDGAEDSDRNEAIAVSAFTNSGMLLWHLGKWEKAFNTYESAVSTQIGDERQRDVWNAALTELTIDLARASYAEQEWAIAENLYKTILNDRADSYRFELINELGAVLLAQGKLQEAELTFRSAITSENISDLYLYPGLAATLEAQGRTQEAAALIAELRSPSANSTTPIALSPAARTAPSIMPRTALSFPSVPFPSGIPTLRLPLTSASPDYLLFPSQSVRSGSRSRTGHIADAYNALARERMEQGRYRSAMLLLQSSVLEDNNDILESLEDRLIYGFALRYQGNIEESDSILQEAVSSGRYRCYVVPPEAEGTNWRPQDYLQTGSACLSVLPN